MKQSAALAGSDIRGYNEVMIKVIVNGAAGKMGSEVVKAVKKEKDLQLVGAVDVSRIGEDAGDVAGIGKINIEITKDLSGAIKKTNADIVIDFTHPKVAMDNVRTILNNKTCAVVGTTGFTDENLREIKNLCTKNKVNCLVAPNFAIGAVLMMIFSKTAAKYMPNVEIIELHHDKKADSPSGTAIKTAELILEAAGKGLVKGKPSEVEKIEGARGASLGGINIHSVRLPGYVAHQEVIFGGIGQTLTIRHDTINRESFMPGVIMAAKMILSQNGLVNGLENLL
jgi:4-hydroxy-tetrahydrodipicolinate reductase